MIERALASGAEPVSLLCERKHIDGDASAIVEAHPSMPVFTGTRELLATLTGYTLTRGVLCAMRRPPAADVGALVGRARRVCVLWDICDATNVGVIFRSAAALGFDCVLLTPGSCDPLTRRAARVSMGTVFQVPWGYGGEDIVGLLHAGGFETVCAALRPDTESLREVEVEEEGRYAVVLGSEGYGLPGDVINACRRKVMIPMSHGVDSLNVGAAAAIFLWHFSPRVIK